MIRGAIYRVDLGGARRGHEQRGRRYGLVLSPTAMPWNVVTIVPTSTSAQPAAFRPELSVAGEASRLMVDQIRTVEVKFVHGEPVDFFGHDEMSVVEDVVRRYLGL